MENSLADVLLTKDHVILNKDSHSLWCDRKDGKLLPGSVLPTNLDSPVTLGKAWGCIGKIRFFSDGEWKLLLVSHASSVGVLPHGGEVFCIERIAIIPLTASPAIPEVIGLEPSPESSGPRPASPALGTKIMRNLNKLENFGAGEKEREKLERRLTEALLWMFNDARSFYFCLDSDITQSLQRRLTKTELKQLPIWQRVDERFFWNKVMLADLIEDNYVGVIADPWILPIIQGYVEIRQIPVLCHETPDILHAGGRRGQEERGRRGEATNLRSKNDTPMDLTSYEMVEMVGSNLNVAELDQEASVRADANMVAVPDSRRRSGEGMSSHTVYVGDLDGYESDTESSGSLCSRDTDDILDERYGKIYTKSGRGGEEMEDVGITGDALMEETGDERTGSRDSLEEIKDGGLGEESKDGGLGEESEDGGLGEESKDGGLGEESKDGGLGEESEDGGLGEESKDGGFREGSKDGGLGEESKDGGLGEEETKQSLDSGSEKQNELVTDPQCSSLTHEHSSTLKEAQEHGLTISNKEHHYRDPPTSSPSPSPPKSSHEDHKSLSDASDRELSAEREAEEDASDKQSVTEKVAASGEEDLFSDRTQPQSGRPDLLDDGKDWRSGSTSPLGNPFLDVEGTGGNGANLKYGEGGEVGEDNVPKFTLAIISRRSRHRAGTRYRRRGVDTNGDVANYVETEMVLQAGSHQVSYVIVRGSVPVYWTQPGFKYRPPPIIEKGEEETQDAFRKHFEEQLRLYKEQLWRKMGRKGLEDFAHDTMSHIPDSKAIVNLVNQTGREKPLSDAFEHHMLLLDNPLLTYIAFDFHRQYKHNTQAGVKLLLKGTANFIKKFKFCWFDTGQASGPLCVQEGGLRVNCIDCLDRTNVIQSVFAKEVLQSALHKLGVIPFDEKLGGHALTAYQEMWGNNGDFISRQYTGTAAMKGDITRYGERKLSGMMKDGYNSAHRYYLNLFSDTYRQVLIDLMQGYSPHEAFATLPRSLRGAHEETLMAEVEEEPVWSLDREQTVADMVQQCREVLFPNKFLRVEGWALVEAAGYSFLESSQKEEDCVMMQCREKSQLCIASYNSDIEQPVCFVRIPMSNIEKIVIGPLGMLLRSSKRIHMRIYYTLIDGKTCYFTFKTMNFTSMDEDKAILLSIADALAYIQPSITIHEQKLSRKRSPVHEGVIYLVLPDGWVKDWSEVDQSADDGSTSSKQRLSIQPEMDATSQSPSPQLEAKGGIPNSHDAVGKADIDDLFEDNEYEQSFSAPSSPKLGRHREPLVMDRSRRTHRLRSQSFDDIISSINNEPVSPTLQSTQTLPSPARKTSVLNYHPLATVGSSSESDSDEEMYDMSNLPRGSLEDGLDKQPPSEASESQQSIGVAFTRLKGRFFQKAKRGTSSKTSYTSFVAQEVENSSETQSRSQVSQKLFAMGQKFRNSPSLLRKMGVNLRSKSPQPPPLSDEDVKRREAREKSQTKFVHIHP